MKALLTIMVVLLGFTAYSIDTVYVNLNDTVYPPYNNNGCVKLIIMPNSQQVESFTALSIFNLVTFSVISTTCFSYRDSFVLVVDSSSILFLGIKEQSTPLITFKNPASKLYLSMATDVTVWSLNGQQVYSGNTKSVNLNPGFYIALIGNRTHKFIIIR